MKNGRMQKRGEEIGIIPNCSSSNSLTWIIGEERSKSWENTVYWLVSVNQNL
jgi:hypothetical protein